MRGRILPALSLLLWSFCLPPAAVAEEQSSQSLSETPNGKLVTPRQRRAASVLENYSNGSDTDPSIALTLLGHDVARGSFQRLYWTAGQAVAGLAMPTPVLVAAGVKTGPTLCLTAAVHGDELNGVETIRRVMFSLESDKLNGVVIGVPIVNMHGFLRTSRYLPDRRDLNRYFPGDENGSSAARIAYSFFNEIISHCDRLIDIHTGSFHRTNLTQLRSDLGKESVFQFSKMFHDVMVLDGAGAAGTLRRAAVDAGIPAVTMEAGEPLRLQLPEVTQSVNGIRAVMHHLKMIDDKPVRAPKQSVFYRSTWLRADQSGVFLSEAELGQKVKKGDILGTVTDPITNRSSVIRSNVDGLIIGMALNQMVMPGFAAYHIGITADPKKVAAEKVADSVVAEALEPVKESLKEVAREAAQSAAERSDDPKTVSEAAREAVKEATKDTSRLIKDPQKPDTSGGKRDGAATPTDKPADPPPARGDQAGPGIDRPAPAAKPAVGRQEIDEHPE